MTISKIFAFSHIKTVISNYRENSLYILWTNNFAYL